MLTAQEHEDTVKASLTANLLVSDLRGMVRSENLLLSDLALEMLETAVRIETKLKRIASIPGQPGKAKRR